MKVDILAIAAHPDDIELSCSGTIMKHIELGKTVVIVDLTKGELGTRGSAELRMKESFEAGKVMGIHARENLGLADGFFTGSEDEIKLLATMIRKYQPEIVLANAMNDRHPDHGRAGKFISDACFYSGLRKIKTSIEGQTQEEWRPKVIYHYIQDYYHQPDFVVDITPYIERKMDAIKAFGSQFYDPKSKEPQSPISGEGFFDFIKGRAMQYGRLINCQFGEGFTVERPIAVNNLSDFK
jgi:bacillithiol biosynthesis deacetylase BshB1